MMSSSAKMIEKLKQGIQGLDKGTECKTGDPTEEPLCYMVEGLTPSMVEEARVQLKETEESRVKGLADLRKLIEKETKLKTPTDDIFLLSFLRARKFNAKKAFKLLQNYWMFRKEHRDIYDASDHTSVKNFILKSIMGFLPYRDKNGSIVMLFKVGLWDPDSDVYEQVFRAVTAILIHSIKFPATQVCGYRIIFDARGLSWTQVKMCTPSNILLLIHSTQYCFPARYRGIHILSENKMFNLAWAVVHPFLTSKLKRRIMLHGNDLKPLLEYIHPSILPSEYGGDAGVFENSQWREILEDGTEHVMDLLNYGYRD